jgi:hypothetical protein
MSGGLKNSLAKRRFFILAVVAFAGLAFPSPALACRTSNQMRTFLFTTLPPFLPPKAVTARVKIITGGSWQHPEITARVIQMLSGPKHVHTLRITPTEVSNCDIMPVAGATGIVVGKLVSDAKGELVVEPMRAPFEDPNKRLAKPAGT